MTRLKNFISNRMGWEPYLKPFLYKKLPSDLGWSATLGSLCALIFVIEAITGMLLAMYYNPSPELAYTSINYITNDVFLGRVVRGIHHWGAGAMVLLVFVHMMTNFFSGSFKAPREVTWVIGVTLFLLTLGLGFTGYLLPWDQKAYWATVVSSNIPRDIPIIGDFITRLMLGGDRVSGLTLTRFFATHMLVLPSLMVMCIAFHIYQVRVHGMAEHKVSITAGKKPVKPAGDRIYRFYPEQLYQSSIAFVIVFAVILLLAVYGHVPLENPVGTIDESYLPRPEWYYMWLFQMLTFFSGSSEVVGSLAIPIGGILILFLMPWLSKTSLQGLADRPLATAVGTAGVIGIIYLTIMGFAGAMPYGEVLPVPDRHLTTSEQQGMQLFVKRECAYCHNINGKGGRIEGPDLANTVAKDRSHEWLMQMIKDPQQISRWSIMPKYDLKDDQLKGLADFILALDFKSLPMKIITKEQALAGTP